MKLLFYYLLIILFLFSCTKKENNYSYTINATVSGIKDSTKILLFNYNTYKEIDSSIIINNHFLLKGNIKEPANVAISIENITLINFWLDASKLQILATKEELLKEQSVLSSYIKGGKTHNKALDFKKIITPFYERKISAYRDLNKKLITKKEYQKYIDSFQEKEYLFFIKNPNNYFSLVKILELKNSLNKKKLKNYYGLLTNKYKNSSYGKLLNNFLTIKPIVEGDDFIDIVGNNLAGKEIKLSDFKGKVILLDFWAGWCPPCTKQIKEEFPNLQEKYKDKNFQIISFSFDFDKNMWKTASDQLKINWPDFSNLIKMSNNPVALKYGVEQIPTSFLINEKGKIIKRIEFNDSIEEELDKFFSLKK